MNFPRLLLLLISLALPVHAELSTPPEIQREFRAAWIATVYNIDWPSRQGLSANEQKAEARAILDQLAALHMNVAILQVRPHADALYESEHEPWSHWLTGTMGKSPGYDPLAFWIQEAHARGIELHAWFNPFRALANTSHPTCAEHISQTRPHLIKTYGTMLWADPSHPETQSQALTAILDVMRRYDIDGIHLDDYFYPYPSGKLRFEDGKTPAERRAAVDHFIEKLYRSVKKEKPWVRVGISPFGIWRPGVPDGIEAGVDSFEHLAGDSRKWLQQEWVDYLAPQLYWRIEPQKQSYTKLLTWWREQGTRPVWPGIATTRINSKEDPNRPASEIIRQIQFSRTIGTHKNGHIHWSVKGIQSNLDNIAPKLAEIYTQPAATPAMPWLSSSRPEKPAARLKQEGDQTVVEWSCSQSVRMVIQTRSGSSWSAHPIVPSSKNSIALSKADTVVLSGLDRYGNTSEPLILSAAE